MLSNKKVYLESNLFIFIERSLAGNKIIKSSQFSGLFCIKKIEINKNIFVYLFSEHIRLQCLLRDVLQSQEPLPAKVHAAKVRPRRLLSRRSEQQPQIRASRHPLPRPRHLERGRSALLLNQSVVSALPRTSRIDFYVLTCDTFCCRQVECPNSTMPLFFSVVSSACVYGGCGTLGKCTQYISGGFLFSTCVCQAGKIIIIFYC